MTEQYTSIINLNAIQSLLFIAFCLLILFKARPEIATGIYLTIGSWGHMLIIGNIAQTWIILATMYGSSLLYYKRHRPINIPKSDRWIIPWVLVWWFWTILLIYFSDKLDNRFLIYYVLATIMPIPAIYLYSEKEERIKVFSIAYVITTMVGGIILLRFVDMNYPVVMINPFKGSYGMGRLPIFNYHSFAYPYGISIIILLAFMQIIKALTIRAVCLSAIIYCLYFLYFSGSRQTIIATLIVCGLFISWLFFKRSQKDIYDKIFQVSSIALIAYVIFYFYIFSYVTITREAINTPNIYDILGYSIDRESRFETWQEAIQQILNSYFMGTVYGAGNVHNYFLSVLANEGIFGFILMSGFFIFVLKQVRDLWTIEKLDEHVIWRFTFLCIFLSTIIHSQFSGDNTSAPELFWSAIYLWYLNPNARLDN